MRLKLLKQVFFYVIINLEKPFISNASGQKGIEVGTDKLNKKL